MNWNNKIFSGVLLLKLPVPTSLAAVFYQPIAQRHSVAPRGMKPPTLNIGFISSNKIAEIEN